MSGTELISYDPAAEGDARRLALALERSLCRREPVRVPVAAEQQARSYADPRFQKRQRGFLALREGRPVAHCVARLSPDLTDDAGRPLGTVGAFEAEEDEDAAKRVLEAAVEALRRSGAGRVVGPMDGDTWHRYRFDVGPRDEPPFLMEPVNPPWYPALWQAAGFVPLESYYSARVDDVVPLARSYPQRMAELAAKGYRLRAADLGRFEEELRRLHALSLRCFRDNYLYTDLGEAEFLNLYRGARALVERDLLVFAETRDGAPAGFLFAFPDRREAVLAMRGERGLLAKLRFLRRRSRWRQVNVKSLGVLPEHRRAGLAGALMTHAYRATLALGRKSCNLCLIREGNPSGRLDGGRGRVFRRYVLYRFGEEPPSAPAAAGGDTGAISG